MLEMLGSAVLAFIERELIKHEPEIEAMVLEQLGKLGEMFVTYVNGKAADVTAKALPDESQPAASEEG